MLNGRFSGDRDDSTRLGRRVWLARIPACWAAARATPRLLASSAGGASPPAVEPKRAGEADSIAESELRAVREQARLVGVDAAALVKSRHYQATGDASPRFLEMIVKDCELLAIDYLVHFRARGFKVNPPDRRLTIVAFQDERPFHRFFPESAGTGVVGGYAKEKNWIVLFDWRNVPQRPRSGAANMTTLAHEAMHQLCFNTGLLSRTADVPLTIVEGLGMYAETRELNGRSDLGQVNRSRLDDLAHILRRRRWVPFKELLVIDQKTLSREPDLVGLFYAESWLLVDFLLQSPNRAPLFRGYLGTLADRFDDSHRIEEAETHFGNLDRFDGDLRAHLVRLQTNR